MTTRTLTLDGPYVETDCVIEHNGRQFEAGGAFVSDSHIIGYVSEDGRTLTTWHGQTLGAYRVRSSWRIHSYIGSRMYQAEVTLPDGRTYTGRTFGTGMLYRGKRKAAR